MQHVPLAARAGLSSTEIAGVAEGPSRPQWTPRQRVLIEAADELHQVRVIGDRTWERLSALLSTEERNEMCFVIGHYEMLAMTLNSLGVEPEDSARRQLDPTAAALAARLAERLQQSRVAGRQPA